MVQASKSDGKQVETPQKNVKAIKDATSEAEHDKTSGTEKKKKVNFHIYFHIYGDIVEESSVES